MSYWVTHVTFGSLGPEPLSGSFCSLCIAAPCLAFLKLLAFSDAGEGAAGQSRGHELLDDMRCPAQRSNAPAIARTLKLFQGRSGPLFAQVRVLQGDPTDVGYWMMRNIPLSAARRQPLPGL